ncbi:MAG: Crp/Fnr family transcriptional regulator [Anaerolineales bacterium]|jgi:CRP/FNR family cyclic AMP-dependent transcriptional regulator
MLNELLKENPVFGCLDANDLNLVGRLANPQNYPKGHWITHLGANWPFIFLVKEGVVQAIKESPGGRSLIVTEITPGDLFWGISFFIADAPMPVALVAKQAASLILWSQEDLRPIILQNGCMSWELTRLMIEKMQFASEMLNEFAFQPTTGRLAWMLLEAYGDKAGDFVARDMTLDEMAARIGSTREMVCRHLYQFADRGAIQINRTEFKILDEELLRELAGRENR